MDCMFKKLKLQAQNVKNQTHKKLVFELGVVLQECERSEVDRIRISLIKYCLRLQFFFAVVCLGSLVIFAIVLLSSSVLSKTHTTHVILNQSCKFIKSLKSDSIATSRNLLIIPIASDLTRC